MKSIFERFDNFFIELINNKIKNRYLDKLMYRITDLGGAIFSTLFSLVLVAFGDSHIRLIGLESLVVLGISQIIVQSLKIGLSRERPYNRFDHLNTFGISMKDYSFPSGHTSASFSIATTLSLNIPGIWSITYLFAIIIGISRIYLAVHYPTDVVAGVVLGIGTSIIVHHYLLLTIERLAYVIGLIN